MSTIRVLVADDFPLMRQAVIAALESHEDIQVVGEAADGEEALARAHETRPDVLLLDLYMPNLSGLGVLARIRDELPETRVLVMTASEKHESLGPATSPSARPSRSCARPSPPCTPAAPRSPRR
jgi:DNA-binding NarL/FixJ family response regulator